jgi:stress-induced morphogen
MLVAISAENFLREALAPVVFVNVADVTDGHTLAGFEDGRAQTLDGRELVVLVVSNQFEGITLLERHRMVHEPLHSELESGEIHSIAIRAWTTKEWEAKGCPRSFSTHAVSHRLTKRPSQATSTLRLARLEHHLRFHSVAC